MPSRAGERVILEFDIEAMETGPSYRLLASVVVPRPIALVSTADANGAVNAAPYSFFNLIGSSPPTVVLGIGSREPGVPKDTRANLERTGEFVVNLVHYELADAMNTCAIEFPPDESELQHAKLTAGSVGAGCRTAFGGSAGQPGMPAAFSSGSGGQQDRAGAGRVPAHRR